jgi:hypothetical protein
LKELNDFDAREIFVEKRIHLGDLQTDFPKGVPGLMTEEKGGNKDQWNNRKRDQRKLSVEMKKKDDDPDEQEKVFDKMDENRSEHLMNILDVVGQTGDQPSHRILIKKGEGEVLEMGEDLHTEVVHHPLACHFHGVDLRKTDSKIDDQNRNNKEGDPENPFYIPPS